ncbi:MAG TPA: molybdenum cofactor biosynthesis protein MoaE [Rhizomicrobium sp.]|jgi:molybdopterin synthase catalytic subunit|nr:molybdenum cofactor biosynthesis protein MoaE [Rhizomicrobium sp.]
MSVRVQTADFDVAAEVLALRRRCSNAGAVVTFTGIVRADDGIEAMTLEHYPGMTEREIARHGAEAQARWPGIETSVIHRVGKLAPGANIVLVAVASSHRKTAFEAAEFLMDYLKTRAPFWKLQQRDGATEWVATRHSDSQALSRWRRED